MSLMLFIIIFIFSILGSIGAIITAGVFLLIKEKTQKLLIPCFISYATGTLLAAALLGMITQSVTSGNPSIVFSFVLGGIIIFFLLEKLVIWRHCHDDECEVHGTAGPILLIGDALHNLIDGIVIAASFLASFHIGVAISISVIAHEVPQEVGDFAILLHGGYSKKKAFGLNLLSSTTTIPGAIISYFVLEKVSSIIPYIMAISAASFIYIALSDLTPELHKKTNIGTSLRQIILILAGISTIILILSLKQSF
jgi:zinc and cadmium transporter